MKLTSNNSTHLPALFDVAGAATYLGVTEHFVRRLRRERRVPYIKLGHFVRFDRADLDSFISEGRVERGDFARA
ncbi:DNA-binding protein [Cryobacterium cheniae]|uniref:DNA-binding protein n=1 Tax=Cryobacterium cheniae TaxID=1259262 RepID=A0A4R8XVJ2_9MICO|nr:helix-turn-helix domain-containing protein [Cryobacterium cheniae]TFC83722.1 DNA-binding protein [Cryobacterium cheniae]